MRGSRVVVTGATGFIGKAVVRRLLREGVDVLAVARSPAKASDLLGPDVTCVGEDGLATAIDGAIAVVNLAGEPVMPSWWTDGKRKRIRDSRIGATTRIVQAIGAATVRPQVLLSASGIGYYGELPDGPCPEDRAPGSDFLAAVCLDWEAAAAEARAFGVRVTLGRIGFVLGPEEGALASLVAPARMGAGGPLGRGDQLISWIHIDDIADAIVRLLGELPIDGPVNLVTATTPQRALARQIGRLLNRPSFMPAPMAAIRLAFGDAASTILGGQEVVPTRLRAGGFRWAFPTIEEALGDILAPTSIRIGPALDVPDAPYLKAHPPARMLHHEMSLAASPDAVLDFLSHPENIPLLTPPGMSLNQKTPRPVTMQAGAEIDYDLSVLGVRVAWTTRIDIWEPPTFFADSATRGPYACWWHEHRFVPKDGGTALTDRVFFAAPGGVLGRGLETAYVEPLLRRIFAYRAIAIRQRLGGLEGASTAEVSAEPSFALP